MEMTSLQFWLVFDEVGRVRGIGLAVGEAWQDACTKSGTKEPVPWVVARIHEGWKCVSNLAAIPKPQRPGVRRPAYSDRDDPLGIGAAG